MKIYLIGYDEFEGFNIKKAFINKTKAEKYLLKNSNEYFDIKEIDVEEEIEFIDSL